MLPVATNGWLVALSILIAVGAVALLFEVNRRLKARSEQLLSSEARYRLAFERSLAGFYHSTLDGRLLECNEAYARIFGYESAAECARSVVTDVYFDPAARDGFTPPSAPTARRPTWRAGCGARTDRRSGCWRTPRC